MRSPSNKKPLKGAISDWEVVGNRVRGTCSILTDTDFQPGESIITSPLIAIYTLASLRYAETENSTYILI